MKEVWSLVIGRECLVVVFLVVKSGRPCRVVVSGRGGTGVVV
jgi:hypothetical protein